MLASKTTLAMGSTLPDGSILAMGALLIPGATRTHAIYAGVPAKPLDVDVTEWAYLHRSQMTPGIHKGTGIKPPVLSHSD